jgi:ribonuclease P protein component
MKPRKKILKAERLKSRKAIQRLFSGQSPSFAQYPVRLIFRESEHYAEAPVRMTVSVPKRKFPKAVDRNRIRRQVREAWRLNKHRLYKRLPADATSFDFVLLYVAKEPLPFAQIEQAIQVMIRRFLKKQRSANPTAR